MIWDDFTALALGAHAGLRERRNAELRAQGIEPTFFQRHYLLPYVIGAVIGPFVIIGLGAAFYGWCLFVASIVGDNIHLGILLGSAPLWGTWLLIRWARKRRARKQIAGTTLVHVRKVP